MKMQVNISKDIDVKVGYVAHVLGIGKRELVDRAILTYIDSMSNFWSLKRSLRNGIGLVMRLY